MYILCLFYAHVIGIEVVLSLLLTGLLSVFKCMGLRACNLNTSECL